MILAITHAQSRILLVEDFEDSRSVLRRLLELEGFQVIEATDGQQAIEAALGESPDLILMDISLPKVDGFQATREIRAAKGLKSPPIIMLSALDTDENRIEAAAAGCSDYITKPIDFDQLLELIGKYSARDGRADSQAASVE